MIDVLFDADAVAAAIAAKADALREQLQDVVAANLAGDVLQRRSGRLADSITSDLDDAGDNLTATVSSIGVPYAAILEYGGKTAAHEIVATKARALAFLAGGGLRFAKRVQHPGSVIPAFAYMGGALDALHDDIIGGLKEAVLDALQA